MMCQLGVLLALVVSVSGTLGNMCQHGVSVSGTLGEDVLAWCPGVEGPSCVCQWETGARCVSMVSVCGGP